MMYCIVTSPYIKPTESDIYIIDDDKHNPFMDVKISSDIVYFFSSDRNKVVEWINNFVPIPLFQ